MRFLLLLAMLPPVACGCMCASLPARCDHFWSNGELVFAGTVSAKIGDGAVSVGNGLYRLTGYEVHFTDVEMFHGTGTSGAETVIDTGHGGGDCGYPFQIGTRYLVYASLWNGRFTTGICSQTAPEAMVHSTEEEWRKLRDEGRADDLFGTIGMLLGNSYRSQAEAKPLPGVSLRLTGEHGARYTAMTDIRGDYHFATLPADVYTVEEDLPAGFLRPAKGTITVDVPEQDASGARCRMNTFQTPDGELAGKIVDAAGQGVAGFVFVELADPLARERARSEGGLGGDDTVDGSFSLRPLPPGRYRLHFHPKIGNAVKFQQSFYWPDDEKGIELKFGEHVEDIRLEVHVPPPES